MPDPTYQLTDHELSVALHEVGEPSVGGVPSLPQARSLLESVITAAAADLGAYLEEVRDGRLRIVADRPTAFVFADPTRDVIAEILQERDEHTGLNEQLIRAIMVHVAKNLTSREWADEDPIVVWKPEDWQRGEDGVERIITWLLTIGLTPAQALDFWATVLRGISQSEWADTRGVETTTVTENVTAARDVLGGE